MTGLFISATHKSSGKTTVTLGLAAALSGRGRTVQAFKKGPDYIDPMWLGAGAGRVCYNLDYNTMSEAEILAAFWRRAQGADLSVIEGNKGLYDGLDLEGGNSNAAVAILLGAPVVLVIDARGMTRGIAPLILGYQAFDPTVRIVGVILNKIGGSRHETKLRAIIEHYTDVRVLGAIHRDPALEITERHLGLIPNTETADAGTKVATIARMVADQVDLEHLLELAAPTAPPTPPLAREQPGAATAATDLTIAVARDAAFGFYYADDLEALEAAGAKLLPIDTTKQAHLPDVDGLFIGGGFPETHMTALQANRSLRHDIRAAIEGGLPTYAECGGLMYLGRTLSWQGTTCEMAGVIPADVVMHETPRGRGYVRLHETGSGPWPLADGATGGEIAAHEFHYSSLENLPDGTTFAYDVLRGFGVDGRHDGIVIGNLVASFAHLRDGGAHRWTRRFVDFVRAHKDRLDDTRR